MQASFVVVVVAWLVSASLVLGQYSGKTGYSSTVYFSDAKCTVVSGGQFTPLGTCNVQGTGSTQFTSDPANNNKIYQSYFSNTGCTGSASGTSALPGNSSCVRSSNSFGAYVQNLVFSATIPTALATSSGTPVFPYTKMTYYYNGCSTLSTAVPSVMAFYALGQASDSSVFCGPQTSCPGPTAAGATQSGTITTCPTPAGTIANTGFAQTNSYNAPPCTAANINNDNPLQAFKLGVCDPQTSTGPGSTWSSQRVDAYTSGSTTVFVLSRFGSSNCGASSVGSLQYYTAGSCPASWTPAQNGYSVLTVMTAASALPTPPTNALVFYDYTSAASCSVFDSTQLVSVSYMSNMFPSDYTQTTKCFNPFDPTAPSNVRTVCGPQTFTAATGGGFVVLRNYTDSACATTPTAMNFLQVGVCFGNSTGSQILTATASGAVTTFKQTNYRSQTCAGAVTGTKTYGDTTQGVCSKTSLPPGTPPSYFTLTYSTAVAITGGAVLTGYATPADCTASNAAKLALAFPITGTTCGAGGVSRNSTLTALGVCGVPTTQVKTLLYAAQTVTSATLTLAIAQTPAFKTNFASAVATTLGVPTTSVNITGVNQVSSRRSLLAGIQVRYIVAAPSAALATALTTVLAASSGALVGVLANTYTGVTVAAPTVSANSATPTGAPVKSAAPRGMSLGVALATAVAFATAWLVW